MPTGLERWQDTGQSHFVTFSCHHRERKFVGREVYELFPVCLEEMRCRFGMRVYGYVVMPEHVHLLVSEPERGTLAVALQMLKQMVSRQLGDGGEPFWHTRYYDFNVWTDKKRIEKLKYMHRNPVKRGLVDKPEDWAWSSFCHYACRIDGTVKIGPQ